MRSAALEVVRVAWMLKSEAGPAGQRRFCVDRQRAQHFQRKGAPSLFLPYLKTLRTGGGGGVQNSKALTLPTSATRLLVPPVYSLARFPPASAEVTDLTP